MRKVFLKNEKDLFPVRIRTFLKAALLFVCAAAIFTTCDVGLGESVDTAAPEIAITYPPTSSVIRGTFTLAGTCSDDKGVDRVILNISSKGTDTAKTYVANEVTVAEDGKSWWVRVNNPEEGNAFNGWQMPDGTYELSVYAIDGVGRQSGTTSRAVIVDNTAPLVVLSNPKSVSTETVYGSNFDVEGTVAEANGVQTLSVKILDAEGNVVSTDSFSAEPEKISGFYTHSNISIKGGTSERFLKYSDSVQTKLSSHYRSVYGADKNAGTKNYKCIISISDDAREFNNAEGDSTAGNTTSVVYLNDEIYDPLMSATGAGLSATDLMNISNGTMSNASVRESLAGFKKDTATSALLFSLNPNVNPHYKVSGFDWAEDSIPGASKNQTVTIVTNAGIDGTLLKPETFKAYIKDFGNTEVPAAEAIAAFLENPQADSSATLFAENKEYSASTVSSYNWDIQLPETIQSGNYYFIAAVGQDADKNELVSGGVFGFKGALSGTPPTVEFTEPSASTMNTSDGLEWKGNAFSSDVSMTLSSIEVSVSVTNALNGVTQDKFLTGKWELEGSGGKVHYNTETKEWSFVMSELDGYDANTKCEAADVADKGRLVMYTASVTATDINGKTTQAKSVTVDTTNPVINITSVSPVVEKKYVNGRVTIAANVVEASLNNVTAIVYVDGTESGKENLGAVSNIVYVLDTKKYVQDASEKEVKVEFVVKDNVGNEESTDTTTYNKGVSYIIKQPSDKPEIKLNNADSSITARDGITTTKNLFTLNTALTGTVTDDDGIGKLQVKAYKEDGTTAVTLPSVTGVSNNGLFTAAKDKTSYTFSQILPQTEGVYFIEVICTDNKNETAYANSKIEKFAVAVDSGAPVITIESPNPNATEQKTKSFTVKGHASKACTITGTWTEDASGKTPKTIAGTSIAPASPAGAADWTSAVDVGSGQGKFFLLYTATDSWGQTGSAKVSFEVDNVPPTFTITQYGSITPASEVTKTSDVISAYANTESTYSVRGKFVEDGSGLDNSGCIYYYLGTTPPSSYPQTEAELNAATGWTNSGTSANSENKTWAIDIYKERISNIAKDTYICILMKDKAGNVSVVADNPVAKIRLTPDSGAPVLSEITPGAGTYESAAFSIGGTVRDDNGFDENAITIAVTKDGVAISGAAKTVTKDLINSTTHNWTANFTVGAGNNLADDGTYKFTVTAKDAAGRTSVKERILVVDTTPPTVLNPSFGTVTVVNHDENPHATLTATGVTDTTSGVGAVKYMVSDTAPTGDEAGWADMTQSGSDWTCDVDFTDVAADSTKKVWVMGIDRAGNKMVSAAGASITVDMKKPQTAITGPVTAQGDSVVLTITVTDTNPTLPTVKIQRAKGEATPGTEFTLTPADGTPAGEGATSYALTIPFKVNGSEDTASNISTDGTYTITVNETDANGRAADEKTWVIEKDSVPPSVTISGFDSDKYINIGSATFSGTIVESNLKKDSVKATLSGTKASGSAFSQEYPVVLGNFDSATNTYSWSVGATGLEDGEYTLKVEAADNVGGSGNAVTAKRLIVDTTPPSSTFNGAKLVGTDKATIEAATEISSQNLFENGGKYYSKGAGTFTLSGKLTEKYIDSAKYVLTSNGAAGPATNLDLNAQGEWSVTGPAADGNYSYKFTFKDKAGNTSEKTISIVRDTAAPVLTLNNLSENQNVGLDNATAARYEINGVAADDFAGTEKITYTILRGSTPLSGHSEKAISVSGSTFKMDAIDFSTIGEGEYTLKIKANDIIRNESEEKTVVFYNDLHEPTVSGTKAYKTGDATQASVDVTNQAFTLTGTVTETNALSATNPLVVIANRADGTQTTWPLAKVAAGDDGWTGPATGGVYTWKLSLTPAVETDVAGKKIADGVYTFVVTATDVVGRYGSAIYNLTSDKTDPVWDMANNPDTADVNESEPYLEKESYKDGLSKRWFNKNGIKVFAKAKDATSGIEKIEYSLDNTNWSEGANGSFNVSAVEGPNNITVRAIDAAGNTLTATSLSANVDTALPQDPTVVSVDSVAGVERLLVNGKKDVTVVVHAEDNTDVEGASSGIKSVSIVKIGTYTVPAGSKIEATTGTNGDYTLTVTQAAINASRGGALTIRVTDNAGNSIENSTLLYFNYDATAPVVTIALPENKAAGNPIKLNGKKAVSGSIVETNPESVELYYYNTNDSVPASLSGWTRYGIISTKAAPDSPAPGAHDTYSASESQIQNWSFAGVNFNDLAGLSSKTSGTLYLLAYSKDAAGNASVTDTSITAANCTKYSVDLESDRPSITVNSINFGAGMASGAEAWLINNAMLSGTITDDDEISRLEYSENASVWNDVTSLSGGAWRIDGLTDGTKTLYFRATDSEGGVWTAGTSLALSYDGESKKVTGSIPISDGTNKYGISGKVDGVLYIKVDTVKPQRASAPYLVYNKDTSEWKEEVSLPTIGGRYTKFKVRLYAGDVNGLDSVKMTSSTLEEMNFTPVTPEETSVVAGVTCTLWESDEIKVNEAPSSLASGSYSGTITIKDNAGLESASTFSFTVDNTAPSVTVSSPTESGIVSGEVTAYGTTGSTDIYYAVTPSAPGAGAFTTWSYYDPGTKTIKPSGQTISNVNENALAAYKKIEDASVSWFIYFDGKTDAAEAGTHNQTLRNYINENGYGITTEEALRATGAGQFNDIVVLYLWLKAVDEVGNVSEQAFPIVFDPQGDRPTVTIKNPVQDAKLGGKVMLYGSATDDKEVKAVFVQLISEKHTYAGYSGSTAYGSGSTAFTPGVGDLDYLKAIKKGGNSVYTVYKMSTYGTDGQKEWNGSLAGGETAGDYGIFVEPKNGGSWSLTINESQEFQKDGDSNNVYARVYAFDGTNFSVSEEVSFVVDAGNPTISEKILKLTSDSSVTRAYEEEMYVKAPWNLTFDVSDNIEVKTINIGVGATQAAAVSAAGATNLISSAYCTSSDSNKTVSVNYPLETGSGVGTLHVYVKCEDSNGNDGKVEEHYIINYDNNAPVLAPVTDEKYSINPSITQSNQFYTLKSKVTEPDIGSTKQSGFDALAFYFVRRNTLSGEVYIIDPMIQRGKDGNKVQIISGLKYEDGIFWKEQDVSDVSDTFDSFTTAESNNIHSGGLAKINGVVYRIESVSGGEVTLSKKPASTYSTALFAYANVVDNTFSEGTGETTKTTEYLYGYNPGARDDGDGMSEWYSAADNTWEADIYSKNIPDGPIEIHYVAFDKAGNSSKGIVGNVSEATYKSNTGVYATKDCAASAETAEYSVYAFAQTAGSTIYKDGNEAAYVRNNAPRLANITVGTDLDGSNSVTEDEFTVKYAETSLTWDAAFTGETAMTVGSENQSKLTLKGMTQIKPEILGGNGAIYYSYKITGTALDSTTVNVTGQNNTAFINEDNIGDLDAAGTARAVVNPITIQVGDFDHLGIKDSAAGKPHKFEFTFWDSTEVETTLDSSHTAAQATSQRAKAVLYMAVEMQDGKEPKITREDLHWTGAGNGIDSTTKEYYNSVAWDGDKALGHIELAGQTWTSKNGTTIPENQADTDAKVSGKIILRGTASDNKALYKLYVKVPQMSGSISGTDAEHGLALATYNGSGNWTVNYNEAKGFKFTVTDNGTDKDGHSVAWELVWDTSYINNVAAPDVTVDVFASDMVMGSAVDNASGTLIGLDGTTKYATPVPTENKVSGDANRPAQLQVDVVPYITALTTSLSKIRSSNPSVYARTALGHYPVYFYKNSTTGDTMDDGAFETFTVEGFNFSKGNGSYTETVGENNDVKTSGYYSKTVGADGKKMVTLNNVNNNDAALTGTDYANAYNRRPNGKNNNILTDDVYIDVWRFNNMAVVPSSQKAETPVMKINPQNGMIGFAFRYGAANRYFAMSNGQTNSYEERNVANDIQNSVSLSYDSDGNSWGTVAGGESGSDYTDMFSIFKNNGDRKRIDLTGQVGNKKMNGDWTNSPDGSTYYPNEKTRFQSPCFATSGTEVYLAYYDAFNNEIRFKNSDNFINRYNDGNRHNFNANDDKYKYNDVQIVAQGNSLTAKPGEYVSIAATQGNVVVMVWYDAVNNNMWYSYNITPGTSRAGSINHQDGSTGWSKPVKVFGNNRVSGEFCKVATDANDDIHIAAYDSATGDVWYAYLDDYNYYKADGTKDTSKAAPVICHVDSDGTVGENLTLDVALNDGTNKKPIPFIGYYSSNRPKIARPAQAGVFEHGVSGGKFTGKWEVAYVPTISNFEQDNINVGVWKNKTTGVIENSPDTASKYETGNKGYVYGNGSNNAVLGYRYTSSTDASRGYIETAQMLGEVTYEQN